jgi:FAD/FMN-containing dehydrogenase/Fe-S oxidoreductase
VHQATVQLGIADDVARQRHAAALRALLRGEVRFDAHDRMLYATDASIYQVEPIGVVVPADLDDLRTLVTYCAREGLPMLPRGGGTSLAGQCVNHAVVVDLSVTGRRVLSVDVANKRADVEPGATLEGVNDELRAQGTGLFFAPDPSTARQATVGGCIGNNAAGTRSVKYGRTVENIHSLDLMLASGPDAGTVVTLDDSPSDDAALRRLREGVAQICREHAELIRERFPKTLRRNAGYALDMILAQLDAGAPVERLNPTPLICGSEGTLGVVTRARLTLHDEPRAKGLAVLGFASLAGAIDAVVPLLSLGPSAVELLDDLLIGLARENREQAPRVKLMPQPTAGRLDAVLYVEFFERSEAAVRDKLQQTEALLRETDPSAAFAGLTDPAEMKAALELRKAGEPLLHGVPGTRKPLGFIEDNAVPPERLSEFVRELRGIFEREGTRGAFYAHASVGVLHVRPLLDLRSQADRDAMERIALQTAELAKSLGGVMSGEHGDGRARGPLLEPFFGPELMQAFRRVKALFDPEGLLNPGDIVTPGPIETIHERTRVRPGDADLHAADIDTYFDYTAESGFDHAVELCNGAGVCRKTVGGTMCPSYRATLDERHSTRGRGNALRLAITGQFGRDRDGASGNRAGSNGAHGAHAAPDWSDPDTLQTLDLCLSCKACKTECPSNVDVAQYKAEYLAQSYKDAGRVPLKAKVFGNVRALNKLGSAFAPLSTRVANSWLHRLVVNRVLGLAPQRTLPPFARSLTKHLRRDTRINAGLPPDAPNVVLFGDCFTMFNEPGIGMATARVLNAFGYAVRLADVGCCGRPAVSVGLLDSASRSLPGVIDRLADAAKRYDAKAVLVCEPSCLSAMTDEWRKLRALADRQQTIAGIDALADLPERFLAERFDDHPRRPAFHRPAGLAALHAHCHQKALWGAESSAELLRRVAGPAKVRVLDTGCCGMAGSFGYTADRYDVSMKIGELDLFPKVAQLAGDDTLIAPGTSCRHQVHDGTGRTALHPMEYVASLLREG